MMELNLRARKNALRAITHFENKHNTLLKRNRWYIEGSSVSVCFEDFIDWIESLDWRYNCGYKVIEIPAPWNPKDVEICLFCDDYLVGHTVK